MPFSRYSGRKVILNDEKLYEEFREKKNLNFVRQYTTPRFRYLSQDVKDSVPQASHIWKTGDRYYKLSHKYYGDSRYWWVIAFFNNKPTEGNVKNGDEILIPLDYQEIMSLYGIQKGKTNVQ